MGESIRPTAAQTFHAQTATAAEHGVPLVEANPHAPNTPPWHLFNNAYRQARHQLECQEA